MAADFSRVRLDPLLDYAGVELKQGGVLLDADANELVAILDRRLRALASDTLGRATVSANTPDAFKITPLAGSLQIGRGRLYVDGLLAENHGAKSSAPADRLFDDLLAEPYFAQPIDYAKQPYLPSPPTLPTSGRHLVYLDVWNREVTQLENTALVESAVGVETSSRLQTVWQVRVLGNDAGAGPTCASPDGDLPGWSAVIAPSAGRLTTGTFQVAPTTDPCELPPTGGYRGLENQLYRVEIHTPGLPGAGATFKWSRENASVGSRVASMISATELELDSLGRDDVLRFNTDDWVEIIDDRREFSQTAGELRKITVTEATRRITFTPPLPADMLPPAAPPPQFPNSSFPAAGNLRVRRWDQKHGVFRTDVSGTPVQVQDLDAAGSTGDIAVPANTIELLLENGVTVRFDTTNATDGFKSGDYWVFAARTSDASVEPLDQAPPRGIHHHYARLAMWDVAAGTASNCRHSWPPTGGSDCGCTACVTPESHASGQLTIQAAVDQLHDTGGTVCLHSGQYALSEPVRIDGVTSLRIHGQGPATVITSPGSAFVIKSSAAIAIDAMTIVSLGRQSAISVRTAVGLALRELVVAVVGNSDARGAAIALTGVVAGTAIEDNLIIASEGVRAGDPGSEGAQNFLFCAALHIENNVLWCQRSGIDLAGNVAHLFETRIAGNEVAGCSATAIDVLGVALPGASMRIAGNSLNVNGPGVRCAVDGAWIERNKLTAAQQGNVPPSGTGITLATGTLKSSSDHCEILANQISGFPLAGIVVDAPVTELIVKLNMIDQCGNGILMADAASAGSLSIENNHLRDIGVAAASNGVPGNAAAGITASITAGIMVARTEAATVTGNTLRRIGLASRGMQTIGILGMGVQRSRIIGNEVNELGPGTETEGAFQLAGIMLRAPYAQTEIAHNHVERDAQPNDQPSAIDCHAVLIDEPVPGAKLVSRMAAYTSLRVDDTRTLVLNGGHAYVHFAPTGVDAAGNVVIRGPSASLLGNVLVARGTTPAVDVIASGEVLFSDNRCELRGAPSLPAVRLQTPIAIVNANRVSNPGDVSIQLSGDKAVAAIGNITHGQIVAANLPPAMKPLNLIA